MPNPAPDAEVFINYRTADAPESAALIATTLSHRFGTEHIFRDGDSLPAGEPFPLALERAVRRCSVLVAVIGPRWLDATDHEGRRALDNPHDWTRREIIEAFNCGVRVVPVLVGTEQAPLSRAELPTELAELADVQFRRLSARDSTADLARLGDELAALVPELADNDGSAAAASADRHADVRNSTGEIHGSVTQSGEYHDRQSGGYRTVTGDSGTVVNGSGGTVINGATGPVNTGPGAQHNGPQYHGPQIYGGKVNNAVGTNNGGIHQTNSAPHPGEDEHQ